MELTFQQLGIAVLLGLLVGLQREHAASGIAGMRTFPLITLLGSLSAILSTHFGDSWILASGLLGVRGRHGRRPLLARTGKGDKS